MPAARLDRHVFVGRGLDEPAHRRPTHMDADTHGAPGERDREATRRERKRNCPVVAAEADGASRALVPATSARATTGRSTGRGEWRLATHSPFRLSLTALGER